MADDEGVGHAEGEVVGAPGGPDDVDVAQQRGGLGDHHRGLHAGELGADAAVGARAEGEVPAGAALAGPEVVRLGDHRRVPTGAGQPQHDAACPPAPATPPSTVSRAATRRQVTIGGTSRSPSSTTSSTATRAGGAARRAPRARRPAGAAAGSGTATSSPARRPAGRTARRPPRRGAWPACAQLARPAPEPVAANSRSTVWKRPTIAARASWRSRVDRGPEELQRGPGELLDHRRRRRRAGRPAGRAPAAAGRRRGRRTGRRARRAASRPREPRRPAPGPRRSARAAAASTRVGCSASATIARIAGWLRCRRCWPASAGRRNPCRGEHPQRGDRHRGHRVERVVRPVRLRVGEHLPDQRVPGHHQVVDADVVGDGRDVRPCPVRRRLRPGAEQHADTLPSGARSAGVEPQTVVRFTRTLSSACGTGTS